MSARFYAELLGINERDAYLVSRFVSFSRGVPAILSVSPWAKHGLVRVYMELWSQNKGSVMQLYDKYFYDAHKNDVIFYGYSYQASRMKTLAQVAQIKSSCNFSGAKTKNRIREFSRAFYEEKDSWD